MKIGNKKYKFVTAKQEFIFSNVPSSTADHITYLITNSPDYLQAIQLVFDKITDSKYNIEEIESGIVISIVYSCLKVSGVLRKQEDFPDKLEEARNTVNKNVYYSIYQAICSTLPSYKLEELERLGINDLFILLAFAEKVSGKQIYDIEKMRKAFLEVDNTQKKGISAVTSDDIAMIKDILAKKEFVGR